MYPLVRRVAFSIGILAAPVVMAQPPSLIEETARLREVAGKQLEAEVRMALSEASRTSANDRPKAVEQYKVVLKKLEADITLADERKAMLVRIVQDRIRVAEASAEKAAESATERKAREAIEKLQKADADEKASERAKVKTGITAVVALRNEKKIIEAAQAAKELLKQYPDDVAVQVLNGISSTANQAQDAKAVQANKDDRRLAAMRDIDRSAAVPNGDIEFPKDWKEKSARRLKAQSLSAAEMHILQALARPISPDFKGSRLQDAIDYIATMSNVTIMVDKSSLDENQLSYDTPVSFAVKTPVSTRMVLRALLNQLGMTYVVRDNVIQVTSQQRARDMMVTKSYYIGDVVAVSGLFGGAAQYGVALDQAQLAQNVAGVVEMITSSLDPMSWQGKGGGTGTIGFNIPTMSLIIRNSAEVHMMMRGGPR